MTDSVYRNIVSATQLADIIKATANTVINDPSMSDKVSSIIVRGAPGLGKSTIVRECAKELGIGFVDIRLAQMERVDFSGLPEVRNGNTHWCVPSIWPTDKNSAGIIFLDEITAAPADVQVAAYALVLDRKIPNADYELPPRWIIVAAGNRTIDRAVAKTMSSALANRFIHFEVDADAEEWTNWAVAHSLHPSVTGFIQYKPASLLDMSDKQNREQGYPTPRSWEKVSTLISMFSSDEDVLQKCIYAAIGPATGVEFIAFHKLQKQFDNVVTWLTDPDAEIEISSKADERYAIVSALAYHLWRGNGPKETQQRIDGLFRVLDKLPRDFQFLLLSLAANGSANMTKMQAITALMTNKNYKAYMEKNKEAFAKKYQI